MKITYTAKNCAIVEWHQDRYELDGNVSETHRLAIRLADKLEDIDADIVRCTNAMLKSINTINLAIDQEIHINTSIVSNAAHLDVLVDRRRETANTLRSLLPKSFAATA